MASIDEQIREILNERAAAIATRDIERLMALYSVDVVYFDVVPPLSYSGAAALKVRFLDWFGRWESPIGQRVDRLQIITGERVATAFMLIEASGTPRSGRKVNYWVRTTNGLQWIDGSWRIAHEHVSLPVDMESHRAMVDLVP